MSALGSCLGARTGSVACAVALLLVAFSCALPASAAPLNDGPYVVQSPDGAWVARWVAGEEAAPQVREEPVKIGKTVEVPAVGSLPAFRVTLRSPGAVEPNEISLRESAPLFVMADTHGELEIAAELLKRQRVIDSALRWSFGKGHLVVLGDVFDRGPHQTEILWLLYELEAEATRAGGGVHLVLGNHESMALGGNERYLNDKYRHVRDALHAGTYAALWSEHTLLGQWLRTKAAVIKAGPYLALHGGLSRAVVDRKLTLAQMNDEVRAALGQRKGESFVLGPEGPQWYRGYFPQVAQEQGFTIASSEDIGAVLAFYGARAIFVGHTIVETVTPLYDGRVVAVQVYPHRDERSGKPVMEGLLVRQGQFFRARIDGGTEPLLESAKLPAAAGAN